MYHCRFQNQMCDSTYRVTQQCCPEPPRTPSAGGLRIFWAKSLVISAISQNASLNLWAISLNFVYMAGITSDLAQKIRRPPVEGLRGVSGWFPPGQHCWATRYIMRRTQNLKKKPSCFSTSVKTSVRFFQIFAAFSEKLTLKLYNDRISY